MANQEEIERAARERALQYQQDEQGLMRKIRLERLYGFGAGLRGRPYEWGDFTGIGQDDEATLAAKLRLLELMQESRAIEVEREAELLRYGREMERSRVLEAGIWQKLAAEEVSSRAQIQGAVIPVQLGEINERREYETTRARAEGALLHDDIAESGHMNNVLSAVSTMSAAESPQEARTELYRILNTEEFVDPLKRAHLLYFVSQDMEANPLHNRQNWGGASASSAFDLLNNDYQDAGNVQGIAGKIEEAAERWAAGRQIDMAAQVGDESLGFRGAAALFEDLERIPGISLNPYYVDKIETLLGAPAEAPPTAEGYSLSVSGIPSPPNMESHRPQRQNWVNKYLTDEAGQPAYRFEDTPAGGDVVNIEDPNDRIPYSDLLAGWEQENQQPVEQKTRDQYLRELYEDLQNPEPGTMTELRQRMMESPQVQEWLNQGEGSQFNNPDTALNWLLESAATQQGYKDDEDEETMNRLRREHAEARRRELMTPEQRAEEDARTAAEEAEVENEVGRPEAQPDEDNITEAEAATQQAPEEVEEVEEVEEPGDEEGRGWRQRRQRNLEPESEAVAEPAPEPEADIPVDESGPPTEPEPLPEPEPEPEPEPAPEREYWVGEWGDDPNGARYSMNARGQIFWQERTAEGDWGPEQGPMNRAGRRIALAEKRGREEREAHPVVAAGRSLIREGLNLPSGEYRGSEPRNQREQEIAKLWERTEGAEDPARTAGVDVPENLRRDLSDLQPASREDRSERLPRQDPETGLYGQAQDRNPYQTQANARTNAVRSQLTQLDQPKQKKRGSFLRRLRGRGE
tara:strand:- start:2373 stop:4787 length:2415 start_codon:yes stop_codon:yes gene_type:complete